MFHFILFKIILRSDSKKKIKIHFFNLLKIKSDFEFLLSLKWNSVIFNDEILYSWDIYFFQVILFNFIHFNKIINLDYIINFKIVEFFHFL